MNKVYLMICLHNHQPVGNFDHVFENHYNSAYKPFLDIYERFSNLPIGLHCSGPLWDWLIINRPEYLDRIGTLVKSGSLELLAGAYYEPILAMIPERDRLGQIKMMRDFIKSRFNQDAKGFWLTERVWEQEMTSTLADAGIEYTLVDDSHFMNAGIIGNRLNGYYLTEDHGKLISVFGTNENLRYQIPFREPEDIRQYLSQIAETSPGSLLVYGDDGEKFGGWPGTYDWVYSKGWLKRFFAMLAENRDWIELITPARVLETMNPLGKIYIPDSSYREMMEWALPPDAGIKYENAVNTIKSQPVWGDASLFFRGGFWRNFKYKYPEANQMYARMLEVSNKISELKSKAPESARKQLYMSQCNCPYWHGVFGGLYLNHLRFETYRNMIRADDAVNKITMKKSGRLFSEKQDFDLDGRDEIALQNDWHRIYIQPHGGGRIYEWDFYPAFTNFLDTLSRRPETYHQKILEASVSQNGGESQSIHGLEKLHDPTIKEHLVYDRYERKSFLDHFITGEISPSKLRRNEVNDIGNFSTGEYKSDTQKIGGHILVTQSHSGILNCADSQIPVDLTKSIKIHNDKPQIECEYKIVNNGGSGLVTDFGMEWNFAMLAGNADDRYYFCGDKPKSGKLTAELEEKNITRFGLVDEWQRIKVTFEFDQAVTLYTFPVETVSQSESAFEKVYQSSVFYPVIELNLDPGEIKQISFVISVDFPV